MVRDGEPDLKIFGLSVWVDGREFPDSSEYYDGNWLKVEAQVEVSGAKVRCAGPILMTSDLQRFRDKLIDVNATLAGEATLSSYEPNLKVTLKIMSLGHVEAEVEITPDHLNQFHRFSFELDQSYLPNVIQSCEAILAHYPIVGKI
jgi:hypothetical protein